jgi:hypothetical protein
MRLVGVFFLCALVTACDGNGGAAGILGGSDDNSGAPSGTQASSAYCGSVFVCCKYSKPSDGSPVLRCESKLTCDSDEKKPVTSDNLLGSGEVDDGQCRAVNAATKQ